MINVLGLSIGLAAGFLIFLYVSFERSYDKFHSKADRIYRLVADIKTPSETIPVSFTSWPFAPNIKVDFPEVESYVRFNRKKLLFRNGDKKFQEGNTLLADSSFFQVFDFKLQAGDPQTALKNPFSIVLSNTAAKKYFGDNTAVGQTLLVGEYDQAATVTGVMEDMPENSQFKSDILLSMTTQTLIFNPNQDAEWTNFDATTFLLLKEGADPKALEKKLPSFLEKHTGNEMRATQMFFTLFLEPLQDIYLNSSRGGFEQGSSSNVRAFSVIAIFILVIAGINFVNLSTARSTERAREVGIRKVVGAEKWQVAWQFIGESVVVAILAFGVSIVLSYYLLPLFNQLAGKTISADIFDQRSDLLKLLGAATAIGFFAGIYPALIMSSFNPVVVLKGRFSAGNKGVGLRKALVITQFTISIALIIATIVVYSQMNFMRSQDLGFRKDQMLVMNTYGDVSKNALKQEILSLPGVKSASLSSSVPGSANSSAYSEVENSRGDMQVANLDTYFIDFDYIPQYGIRMVAGRPFSRNFGTDTTEAMVINESAVKLLGYRSAQEAIGKKFSQWGRSGRIIGVIKDFHFHSLHEVIKPLCMRMEQGRTELLSVNIAGAQLPQALAAIEEKWRSILVKRPFEYYFLDEFFDRQYRSEQRFGKLFLNFAILAILISCLGLLGLASYTTLQRTKEIGVRKVIGASTADIVHLLSKNFLQLVGIAFIAAVPLGWYFMNKWLQDFPYRITVQWWVFLVAGALAILTAFFTVSFLAVRAALANPVKSLRSE